MIEVSHPPSDPVLTFAADELRRLLASAWQGSAHFTLDLEKPQDREQDRCIIAADAGGGRLSGSNPRSVLFAVYRYLRELGFRWVRPGREGTIIPKLTGELPPVQLDETASSRYRTICIEGACSLDHVIAMVDWATKHGMNGYFLQFDYGTCFWRWWYMHVNSPCWDGANAFEVADAKPLVESLVSELHKRGLFFERVGHGWTSRAVGLEGEGWDQDATSLSAGQQALLAEIDGERGLFHGVALNTNLCYSNPVARSTIVADMVDYARQHPEVDLLHLWLADGTNNHCECSTCQPGRPADWYVVLLNELDAALTEAGLATRIVFLIYVDLLWPPVAERLANPSRFVLMFAPITRTYTRSFAKAEIPEGPLPDYQRNHLDFPRDVGRNLQLLRSWQDAFEGDGFDFDYHMIWPCFYDFNQVELARVLHQDIRHLPAMGLDGYNSCQNQRTGFPNNLIMQIMADTLWNHDTDFDQLVRRWFEDAFGDGSRAAEGFFREASELWKPIFDPVYQPARDEARIEQGLENLGVIAALAERLGPGVEARLKQTTGAQRRSWRYLSIYLQMLDLLLPAFESYLLAEESCRERFEALNDWLWRREKDIHPGIDVYRCTLTLMQRVNELEAWRRISANNTVENSR